MLTYVSRIKHNYTLLVCHFKLLQSSSHSHHIGPDLLHQQQTCQNALLAIVHFPLKFTVSLACTQESNAICREGHLQDFRVRNYIDHYYNFWTIH
jgi:hypothetical protein